MPEIIVIPHDEVENSSEQNEVHHFGYFETKNSKFRPTMEDALAWCTFTQEQLTPQGSDKILTPQEIGHRLWTSYLNLDESFLHGDLEDGSTASTTVYDGKGNFITATLADAASFAAVYGTDGKVIGVVRLNTITHKPDNDKERKRIEDAGGSVRDHRVNGRLAVSRAIGDKDFKKTGVSACAQIDVTNMAHIAAQLNTTVDKIGCIKIITTCDGFTDGAGKDTKKAHEAYLKEALEAIPVDVSENILAQHLVKIAKKGHSGDNITVTVQTVTKDTPAFLLGVYDGHGGKAAAAFMAENIAKEFTKQCTLSKQKYAEQPLSTNKRKDYLSDNTQANTENNMFKNSEACQLNTLLGKELNVKKIQGYQQKLKDLFTQFDAKIKELKQKAEGLGANEYKLLSKEIYTLEKISKKAEALCIQQKLTAKDYNDFYYSSIDDLVEAKTKFSKHRGKWGKFTELYPTLAKIAGIAAAVMLVMAAILAVFNQLIFAAVTSTPVITALSTKQGFSGTFFDHKTDSSMKVKKFLEGVEAIKKDIEGDENDALSEKPQT